MTPKPDFERLRTALFCGEPDRVPLADLAVAKNIKEAFMGRPVENLKDDIDFWAAAGYDYIKLSAVVDINPSKISKATGTKLKDESTGVVRNWASEAEGVITNMEEFERYVFPTFENGLSLEPFEQAGKLLPPGMKVVGHYGDIFTWVWTLMGFETFSMALFDKPELVERMFDKLGALVYDLFERMVEYDCVGALWFSDDVAYTESLMVSPATLRQFLFPWMKKMGDLCKANDMPFIYHSDGDLFPVFDDIIDCGVNAIQPIEPKAMDILEAKEKVGGKLCVIGNIDLIYTLTRGTVEDVEAEVKERIRTVGPGGGYALGTANTVPDYVIPENYRAMVEACLKYGKYPINV
jgi:uroporphyrinogen decarboxylase